MDVPLPKKTCGDFTLSDGTKVWIRTINRLQREKAENEAQWTAASATKLYRKGGKRHASLVDKIKSLTETEQCTYLAGHEIYMGRIQKKVAESIPLPEKPERNSEQNDEAWMKTYDEWEKATKAATEQRKQAEDAEWKTINDDCAAMATKARVDKCIECAIERHFVTVYIHSLTMECLLQAVRMPEDHSEPIFSSVQEIEDLDDDVRQQLEEFYYSLDSVSSTQIPT